MRTSLLTNLVLGSKWPGLPLGLLWLCGCSAEPGQALAPTMAQDAGPPVVVDSGPTGQRRCVVDWRTGQPVPGVVIANDLLDSTERALVDGCFYDDELDPAQSLHIFAPGYEYRSIQQWPILSASVILRSAGGTHEAEPSVEVRGQVLGLEEIEPDSRGIRSGLVSVIRHRSHIVDEEFSWRSAEANRTQRRITTVSDMHTETEFFFDAPLGSIGLEVMGTDGRPGGAGEHLRHYGTHYFDTPLSTDLQVQALEIGFSSNFDYPLSVTWNPASDYTTVYDIGWLTVDGWFVGRQNIVGPFRPGQFDALKLVAPVGRIEGASLLGVRLVGRDRARQYSFHTGTDDHLDFSTADLIPGFDFGTEQITDRTVLLERDGQAESERCRASISTEQYGQARAWQSDFPFRGQSMAVAFPSVPEGFEDPFENWRDIRITCERFQGWDPWSGTEPTAPYDGVFVYTFYSN